MRVLWWATSWSDGWHAMDCSVALPELSEHSTAVWRSFCSISSFLPSFHASLKALLPAVCSRQPSTGSSLGKPHVHVIPPWCLLLGGYVMSTVMLCYLLNIVRLDVLACYLDFPVYFHTGAQLIIFFSTCCLCLVLIPRWYCPWCLVEFIWKTIWACWVSERESIGRI